MPKAISTMAISKNKPLTTFTPGSNVSESVSVFPTITPTMSDSRILFTPDQLAISIATSAILMARKMHFSAGVSAENFNVNYCCFNVPL